MNPSGGQRVTGEKVVEIRPGAAKRAPIAEKVARARCDRPHKDPDPCYDIQVPVMIDDPRWAMPRESKTETETVHIPGCMGCAVYGHERCCCHE